jgi:hypothetical protein
VAAFPIEAHRLGTLDIALELAQLVQHRARIDLREDARRDEPNYTA